MKFALSLFSLLPVFLGLILLTIQARSLPSPKALAPTTAVSSVPSVPSAPSAPSDLSALSAPSASSSSDLPSSSDPPSASISAPPSDASNATTTSSSNSTISPSSPVSTAIPRPFDSGYDYKLTPSCSSFFKTLLKSSDFTSCYSFGFLMIDSLGFSRLSRNASNLPPLLDQICATTANNTPTICNKVMNNYMTQMADADNCGTDLTATPPNPVAYQAYLSFVTYNAYQAVGCLKNSTGQYCYVDKLLDKKDGISLYLLPKNTRVSNTTAISCSDCTQLIMVTYSQHAGVVNTPLNSLYAPTAQYVQSKCGLEFVPSQPVPAGAMRWRTSKTLLLVSSVIAALILV